jgi:hypothetical protein
MMSYSGLRNGSIIAFLKEKDMKQIAGILMLTMSLWSCSGANDGSAATDTTTMPVDTNVYKTQTNTTNRADGTIVVDSVTKDSVHVKQ